MCRVSSAVCSIYTKDIHTVDSTGCGPLWTTVDHCGPQQAAQGSVAAKLSVGQTDGHLQRYHQWLFEGGEVLLNSGAVKDLADEHMHAHH